MGRNKGRVSREIERDSVVKIEKMQDKNRKI